MPSDQAAVANHRMPKLDAGDMEEILAEAREAFVAWALEHLDGARRAAPDLADDGHQAACDAIFGVFHDLKGGGGSVGLDLMSGIGDSACKFLKGVTAPDPRAPKVALAHIAAAEGVLKGQIMGDGGEGGALLLRKLRAIAA